MDLRDTRELALQRLTRFCRAGFVSVTDFRHAPLRIFAAHEVRARVAAPGGSCMHALHAPHVLSLQQPAAAAGAAAAA